MEEYGNLKIFILRMQVLNSEYRRIGEKIR